MLTHNEMMEYAFFILHLYSTMLKTKYINHVQLLIHDITLQWACKILKTRDGAKYSLPNKNQLN